MQAHGSVIDAIVIYYDSGLITAEQCAALGVTADQIQSFFSSEQGMSQEEFYAQYEF